MALGTGWGWVSSWLHVCVRGVCVPPRMSVHIPTCVCVSPGMCLCPRGVCPSGVCVCVTCVCVFQLCVCIPGVLVPGMCVCVFQVCVFPAVLPLPALCVFQSSAGPSAVAHHRSQLEAAARPGWIAAPSRRSPRRVRPKPRPETLRTLPSPATRRGSELLLLPREPPAGGAGDGETAAPRAHRAGLRTTAPMRDRAGRSQWELKGGPRPIREQGRASRVI